ncbi:hypothetical protein KEM48_006331, partial [Puccinia striiformis f. sp. tritici PST-130]
MKQIENPKKNQNKPEDIVPNCEMDEDKGLNTKTEEMIKDKTEENPKKIEKTEENSEKMVQKDERDSQFPENSDEDKYEIDPVTSDRLYKFPVPADGFFEDPEEMLHTIKDFSIERGYAIVCERSVTGKSKTLKCD